MGLTYGGTGDDKMVREEGGLRGGDGLVRLWYVRGRRLRGYVRGGGL